jgi:lipopolysaccharide export system protein LptA
MSDAVAPYRDLIASLALLLAMATSALAQPAPSAAAQTGAPNPPQGSSKNRDQPARIDSASLAAPVQTGVPNALQGFSKNRDQPVKIDSASLEVRDKDKIATFSGNVHLSQGDTTLRCKTLVVYYDDSARSATLKAAAPNPAGHQQISRLEAKGGVTVNQKDQTATGSTGVFDMKTNTVTLSGNVVVTQGQNVLRGERLIVDLTSGVSRVEGGRVQGLFLPHSQHDQRQPGDKEPARPTTSSPFRLN